MNAQLNQLAAQIDGQVAQACGSYDPNVKGSYLFQKYPQVRSCASYNEAILLLAVEQSNLQSGTSFAQTPFGQPPASFGQPPAPFGQPPVQGVFGTPATPITGQPAAVQFSAFNAPQKPKSDKVLGFIPSKVFAVVVIALVVLIVVGGIAVSIVNAVKGPGDTVEQPYEEVYEDQSGEDSVDSLFE